MGGGLENLDLVELKPTDVSYKIVARGWMDLCNPARAMTRPRRRTR